MATNQDILNALKAMQGEDANGDTVTLAVLKSQYERMEKAQDKRAGMQDADHDRLVEVEGDMKVLKTRVGLFAGGQLIVTAIASAIATALGRSN